MREIGNGHIRAIGEGVHQNKTGNFTLRDWALATSDAPAIVEAAGFFNPMAGVLTVGSVIEARMGLGQGGTPEYKNYIVSANDGTAVTIKLQKTALG